MNIITSLEPAGDFATPNGQLYAFMYGFEDGTGGVAYHKTPQPPFQIGSEVDVIPKGVSDQMGNPKIQVKKPGSVAQYGAPQGGGYQQSAPQQAGGAVHGATVGMAVNNAVSLTVAEITPCPANTDFKVHLRNVAYEIIQVSQSLEKGWKPGQAAKPAQAPQPVAPAPAPPPVQQPAPAQQPVQQYGGPVQTQPVAGNGIEEEIAEVPF